MRSSLTNELPVFDWKAETERLGDSSRAGAGGHRLRSCLGANRKRRTFKCRVHLRGQPDLLKLKIVARLIDPHGVIARVQRVGPPT